MLLSNNRGSVSVIIKKMYLYELLPGMAPHPSLDRYCGNRSWDCQLPAIHIQKKQADQWIKQQLSQSFMKAG